MNFCGLLLWRAPRYIQWLAWLSVTGSRVDTSALGANGQLLPTATESDRSQTYCYSDIVSQLLSVTDVHRNYSSTALAPPRCGGRGTPRRGLLADIILFVLVISSGLVPVDADFPGLCDAASDVQGALNGAPLQFDVAPLCWDVVPCCLSSPKLYGNPALLTLQWDVWLVDALLDGDWCVDVLKLSWRPTPGQLNLRQVVYSLRIVSAAQLLG